MRHQRRHARRSINRQTTLVPVEKQKDLTNEEKTVFLTQLSQLGVIHHLMKPSSTKKIEQATKDASRILPSTQTLELFRGKTSGTSETVN
jgi:hypothetical protein